MVTPAAPTMPTAGDLLKSMSTRRTGTDHGGTYDDYVVAAGQREASQSSASQRSQTEDAGYQGRHRAPKAKSRRRWW